MSNRGKRGFIKLEAILALMIIMTILPLAISAFSYVANFNFEYESVEEEITLIDLRRILLLAYDLNVDSDQMQFIYKNNEYTLRLVNRKLLLQPGSQMFLNNVDFLYFYESDDVIYIKYFKENKEYEKAIASAKRVYLAEFSNDNDEHNESSDNDESKD